MRKHLLVRILRRLASELNNAAWRVKKRKYAVILCACIGIVLVYSLRTREIVHENVLENVAKLNLVNEISPAAAASAVKVVEAQTVQGTTPTTKPPFVPSQTPMVYDPPAGQSGSGTCGTHKLALSKSSPRHLEADVNLNRGLSVHWDFEDKDSHVFQDKSKHSRTARSKKQMHRVRRCDGKALSFRGKKQTDFLVADNSKGAQGFDLGTSFTFSCWLHLSNSPRGELWQTIMDNGVSGLHRPSFGMRVLGGRLAVDFLSATASGSVSHNFPYLDNEGSNSPTAISRSEVALKFGVWTHVVFTMHRTADSQIVTVYLDGQIAFKEPVMGNKRCGDAPSNSTCQEIDPLLPKGLLWIGREAPLRNDGNARALDGALDDLRIYSNRSLSLEEVRALHELESCDSSVKGLVDEGKQGGNLLLQWSFEGNTLNHADVIAVPAQSNSNVQGQLLPLPNKAKLYYFRKGPPIKPNPRRECHSNGIHGCEVRFRKGVPYVRAISADRCYFVSGGSTTDFGKWVRAGKGKVSCATNHFFSREKVACALDFAGSVLSANDVRGTDDLDGVVEKHMDWYNRAVKGLARPAGPGESWHT